MYGAHSGSLFFQDGSYCFHMIGMCNYCSIGFVNLQANNFILFKLQRKLHFLRKKLIHFYVCWTLSIGSGCLLWPHYIVCEIGKYWWLELVKLYKGFFEVSWGNDPNYSFFKLNFVQIFSMHLNSCVLGMF